MYLVSANSWLMVIHFRLGIDPFYIMSVRCIQNGNDFDHMEADEDMRCVMKHLVEFYCCEVEEKGFKVAEKDKFRVKILNAEQGLADPRCKACRGNRWFRTTIPNKASTKKHHVVWCHCSVYRNNKAEEKKRMHWRQHFANQDVNNFNSKFPYNPKYHKEDV